jgi:thiol-disulfide isomerase/thioredoxin
LHQFYFFLCFSLFFFAKMSIVYFSPSLVEFKEWIASPERGTIIIKLGAEWCGPCKRIENLVNTCMTQIKERIPSMECAVLDIDETFEVYAFLKTKRVVNGIPAILVYYRNNAHYIPDDVVIGSDENQVLQLFNRTLTAMK